MREQNQFYLMLLKGKTFALAKTVHIKTFCLRPDLLDDLISSHDVVVSLLPWTLHPFVAERAIANKTNMVTASYLSPGLQVYFLLFCYGDQSFQITSIIYICIIVPCLITS